LSQVPRRRRNDPLGVSDNPSCVSDPVRTAEIAEEFKRRLAYVQESYRLWEAHADGNRSFNESLTRLKKALSEPAARSRRKSRLDPRLEIMINHRARNLAGLPPDELLGADHVGFVQQAAMEIATSVPALKGRPASERVRFHVEALMALIQETCGMPVLALRDRDDVYDPHLPQGVSRIIPLMFSLMDPAVTETQLVNIVRQARRVYSGKRMRFRDFFPLCGGEVDQATLAPIPRPPFQLLHFEVAAPIYCP
jgi:hypothetical protein